MLGLAAEGQLEMLDVGDLSGRTALRGRTLSGFC